MATQRIRVDLKNLGMTETERFNQNYIHPTERFIEVINVRRNPKAKGVYFFQVKDSNILRELISNYTSKVIEPGHITHNTFAVRKYQLSEIK